MLAGSLLPAAFFATTVQVYFVSFMRFVKITGELITVVSNRPGVQETSYPLIAAPLSEGGVNLMEAVPFPGVALTFTSLSGLV